MIYLATPYIHKDKEVCEARALAVTKAAAYFMDHGEVIYSPITHGHAINKYMKMKAGVHEFWLNQCYFYVTNSEAVYVLGTVGWIQSKGVRWEVETAWAFNIPVFYVAPDTYEMREMTRINWLYEASEPSRP